MFSIFRPHGSACACFGLKELNLHLRNTYGRYIIIIYNIYIYEKSTVQHASVGLAQARPNKKIRVIMTLISLIVSPYRLVREFGEVCTQFLENQLPVYTTYPACGSTGSFAFPLFMEYLESACKINNAYRNSFHHKTYTLRAHMLASYMTAVQIPAY